MMKNKIKLLTLLLLTTGFSLSHADPKRPECIAPAKPGGGFDLTCRIATTALEQSNIIKKPMAVTFVPGGIGAVAINQMISTKRKDGNLITAFSSGSLLYIANGKFGAKINADSVKWLATVGADYGTVWVKKDSPIKSLKDLVDRIKKDPKALAFGAGGSIGSQDWTKAALLFKAADTDPRKMRYLAFDGGGESMAAVLGGHIDVYTGDAGEYVAGDHGKDFRLLAVLSDNRLEGKLKDIPTAKEQGYDIVWPTIRGFYMAPNVSDADYNFYLDAFNKLYQTDEFKKIRTEKGLFKFNKTGKDLDNYVKNEIKNYKKLSKEFGL